MTLPEYLAKLEALPECKWLQVVEEGGLCQSCRHRLAAFPVLLGMVKAAAERANGEFKQDYGDNRWGWEAGERILSEMTSHIPPADAERGRG